MPYVGLILAGVGAYAGYRLVTVALKATRRPAASVHRAPPVGAKNLGDLDWDADAQVYRPRQTPHSA